MHPYLPLCANSASLLPWALRLHPPQPSLLLRIGGILCDTPAEDWAGAGGTSFVPAFRSS